MRIGCFLLLLPFLTPFLAAAQSATPPSLKPASLEFANTYGTWVPGKAYSVKFTREGGAGCSALNADLSQMPAGFTWTAGGADNGVLSGTFGATGKYKFGLAVQCTTGGNAALSYTINVNSRLSVLKGPFLADAHMGAVYGIFLRSGGVKPFTLTVTSGALPPGLAWDADSGVLVGTPTSAGTFTFGASITDRMTDTGEASYSLLVGPPGGFYTTTNRLDLQAMVGSAADTVSLGVATSDLTVVNYAVVSNAAWLTAAPGSGTTPDSLSVQVNPAGLAKGNYQGQLTLTPDGGKSPATVTVALQVKDPVPLLGAAPDRLQVEILPDPGAARQFQFDLQAWNAGSGTLTAKVFAWNGVAGHPWFTVQPANFTATPGQMQTVTLNVDARGFAPGSYQGSIVVSAENQVKTIPLLLVVPVAQHVPILKINKSSWWTGSDRWNLVDRFQYYNSWVIVSNEDTASSFDFTAALQGFPPDSAHIETPQGRIGPWPGMVELNFRFNNFRIGTGHHEGLLTVTAPGAKNSPVYAKIRLDISNTGAVAGSATAFEVRNETPILVKPADSSAPLQARIVITNPSNVPVSFRVVADQPDAVTVDVPAGTATNADPVTVTATVNLDRMRDRAMHLTVSASPIVGGATVYYVPAYVITPVKPGALDPLSRGLHAEPPCASSLLVLGASTPPGNFKQQADEPLKIRAFVYNDCGLPVADAMVTASFSNGDETLMLPAADAAKGIYETTWVPGVPASSVGVTLRATRSGLTAATQKIFGSVTEDAGGPVVLGGGIVNAANPVEGAPVSPGGLVSIRGKNLSNSVEQSYASPLPRTLAGAKVLIGGIEAPILYAGPGQITAQVPLELTPDSAHSVVVASAGRYSTPKSLQLVKLDPGLMAFADGRVIALRSDFTLIDSANTAMPGEWIVLYLAGMGATQPAVPTGERAPYATPAVLTTQPVVTIGGATAQIHFAGLVPGCVGLYQIVCQVPAAAASGDLPVVVTQDGVPANTAQLPVKR